ncbi:unnamed protein product [Prorocentrum cordatum]|uniref:Uncharacterized protein n=1 Tax=Prorocentrum cordatum TaxID=2364126 RepID=A0ABN9UH99_9DINO|nr:unnamed protein product [Polarella glacialis]
MALDKPAPAPAEAADIDDDSWADHGMAEAGAPGTEAAPSEAPAASSAPPPSDAEERAALGAVYLLRPTRQYDVDRLPIAVLRKLVTDDPAPATGAGATHGAPSSS